jgi:hypothetical protein
MVGPIKRIKLQTYLTVYEVQVCSCNKSLEGTCNEEIAMIPGVVQAWVVQKFIKSSKVLQCFYLVRFDGYLRRLSDLMDTYYRQNTRL